MSKTVGLKVATVYWQCKLGRMVAAINKGNAYAWLQLLRSG